jgi:hypothetical protein
MGNLSMGISPGPKDTRVIAMAGSGVSVVTKSEGPRIEITEGRSEGPVFGLGFAKLSLEGATVRA